MEDFKKQKEGPTIAEAISSIQVIEQMIRMGPADTEFNQLALIKEQLVSGELSPSEAIDSARKIEEERSSHYR